MGAPDTVCVTATSARSARSGQPGVTTTSQPIDSTPPAGAGSSLPSIFAIPSLRHRIAEQGKWQGTRDELIRLLRLDPLTLLRCLRQAGTSFVRTSEPIDSIPALVRVLGRTFVQRAIRVPAAPAEEFRRIHTLWLNAIATAQAAEDLARASGTIDPDQAYLRGLLRRLPCWVELLDRHARDIAGTMERWNLPKALRDDLTGSVPPAIRNLFEAAEILSDLADFPSPREQAVPDRSETLASISRESLVQARELRRSVHHELEQLGLDSAYPPDARTVTTPDTPWQIIETKQTEFIRSLLMCRQTSSYRSIITVGTSAALRFLDCDRATFISWHRDSDRCFIRSKADFTIRRTEPTPCGLARFESEALLEALVSEKPQTVTRPHARPGGADRGLLHMLGADDAMIIVVSREFETPTFLVLDRTLSGRDFSAEEDFESAAALGGTLALLTDNLRLRLDRIRAQRFAVTDPLTRLNNRTVGLMALEREMLRARREDIPLSVLMLDLDEFKELNDTHGHVVGDQALRLTANVLRRTLRRSDVVCRYGGEEFLVVLPATSAEEASVLAARLFVEVEAVGTEYRLPLTVSIGLARLRDGDQTTDDFVARADHALYASKTRGRNRFSVDTA